MLMIKTSVLQLTLALQATRLFYSLLDSLFFYNNELQKCYSVTKINFY